MMKQNKTFWIGISLGVMLILAISITFTFINNNNEEIEYYAIADISTNAHDNPFYGGTKITYEYSWISTSSLLHYAPTSYKGFLMRFNIESKPKTWSKCEISLYQYKKGSDGTRSGRVYLFEGNWTEKEWDGTGVYMRDLDIYWKINDYIAIIVSNEIGFQRIDITFYMKKINTTTFSIAVAPYGTTYSGSRGCYYYSSEWDGSDFPYCLPEEDSYLNYLPQLIWS